jgi:primosomal protein N'
MSVGSKGTSPAFQISAAFAAKRANAYKDVQMLVYGPFEAPVFKIKNKFRMRIVVKFKNNKRTRALFEELIHEYGKKASGKITLSVDINPSST